MVKKLILVILSAVLMFSLAMGLTACNKDTANGDGLEYKLNDDGSAYAVEGIGTFTGKKLVIPSTYNGKPVTSIGSNAFYYCRSLTSVIIPDSIQNIGSNAFQNCSSLTSVIIGNSVESIGSNAFSYCSKLTSVTIGNSVQSIGSNAFDWCMSLTSVTFENANGWSAGNTAISSSDLSNASTAATYLKSTYYNYTWKRS